MAGRLTVEVSVAMTVADQSLGAALLGTGYRPVPKFPGSSASSQNDRRDRIVTASLRTSSGPGTVSELT